MKRFIFSIVVFLLVIGNITAQDKKAKDIEAIKSLCGCYDVEFNFIETFNYSEEMEYKPSRTKRTSGLEWVQLVEEDDDKIVLQHLLVVGKKGEQFVIKHWREDWMYENTDLYVYDHDSKWKFVEKTEEEVAGQWTQKVFQVDDSPRYEGTATWVHVDGRSFWQNTTDAPLPRREYSKRDDYNVSVRGNHIEVKADRWIHDQDNLKVVRAVGKEDFILAEEKGLNNYIKTEQSRCQAAIDWWATNQEMWSVVRKNWDKVFAKDSDLTLKAKVEDKPLYEHLFALDVEETKPKEIKAIITEFVQQ